MWKPSIGSTGNYLQLLGFSRSLRSEPAATDVPAPGPKKRSSGIETVGSLVYSTGTQIESC